MSQSVSEFWTLLRGSGLLAPGKIDAVRAKLEQADKAGSVRQVVKQLVGNRLLTQYQARMLSQGRCDFVFGDYVIRELAEQGAFPGWYVAEDHAGSGSVLLKPISAKTTDSHDELVVQASQFLRNVRLAAAGDRWFLVASDTSAVTPPPIVPSTPTSDFALGCHSQREPQLAWGVVDSKLDTSEPAASAVGSDNTGFALRHSLASQPLSSNEDGKSGWPAFTLPVLSLLGCAVLLAAGIVAWNLIRPEDVGDSEKAVETASAGVSPRQVNGSVASPFELTDSPEALWARPEFGDPIDIRYLPMGAQAIVRLRLSELIAHPEGERILRSLGPEITESLKRWSQQFGVAGSSVDTLTIGLLPQGTTWPKTVGVAVLTADHEVETLDIFDEISDEGIARRGGNSFWFPVGDQRTFVFGPASIIDELRTRSDLARPLLRRELEHLRQATHDTDHITILANPNFLRDEAQGLFAGQRRPLLDGLYEFWSDHGQAVLLGIQLSDVAVAELRMIARDDWLPERLSFHARRQLDSLPSRVGDYLGRVQLDPYWQHLALRFPGMLRFVTEQTRVVVEGRQVAVSTALPVEAVHNLLLATELTLASPLRGAPEAEQARSDWTIDDVLATKMTVRFAQKSLEFAMRDVAGQVRDDLRGLPFTFSIEIIGTDLEPEGITRNQQIRNFHEVDRPLGEILSALVIKANPEPDVAKPSDPNQKLVWVVEPGRTGRILITTRSAVAHKNWELPSSFLE